MLIDSIVSAIFGLLIAVIFQEPLSQLFNQCKDFTKKIIKIAKPYTPPEEITFSFGKRKTSVIILDGDGRESYEPDNITAYLSTKKADAESSFKTEVEYFRNKTIEELAARKATGENIPWNGNTISLSQYRISRSDIKEKMRLDLALSTNEYYASYAVITHLHDLCINTNRKLDDYIEGFDFTEPFGHYDLPNSIGVCLQVVTKDYKTIFSRRSLNCGFRPGEYDVSVVEGLNDADVVDGRVDFYAVARRGCREELCDLDESEMSIHLLGLFFDKTYSQWNLVGIVELGITQDEILRRRNSGVNGRWEVKGFDFIRLELKDIIVYLCTHKIWDMGLATAYFALVYKLFDRKRINSMIEKYQ